MGVRTGLIVGLLLAPQLVFGAEEIQLTRIRNVGDRILVETQGKALTVPGKVGKDLWPSLLDQYRKDGVMPALRGSVAGKQLRIQEALTKMLEISGTARGGGFVEYAAGKPLLQLVGPGASAAAQAKPGTRVPLQGKPMVMGGKAVVYTRGVQMVDATGTPVWVRRVKGSKAVVDDVTSGKRRRVPTSELKFESELTKAELIKQAVNSVPRQTRSELRVGITKRDGTKRRFSGMTVKLDPFEVKAGRNIETKDTAPADRDPGPGWKPGTAQAPPSENLDRIQDALRESFSSDRRRELESVARNRKLTEPEQRVFVDSTLASKMFESDTAHVLETLVRAKRLTPAVRSYLRVRMRDPKVKLDDNGIRMVRDALKATAPKK